MVVVIVWWVRCFERGWSSSAVTIEYFRFGTFRSWYPARLSLFLFMSCYLMRLGNVCRSNVNALFLLLGHSSWFEALLMTIENGLHGWKLFLGWLMVRGSQNLWGRIHCSLVSVVLALNVVLWFFLEFCTENLGDLLILKLIMKNTEWILHVVEEKLFCKKYHMAFCCFTLICACNVIGTFKYCLSVDLKQWKWTS